jgi:hypothetical protein
MKRIAGGMAGVGALLLSSLCMAQGSGGIHGDVFRDDELGLTYDFPAKFSPKVESKMPAAFHDGGARERMILTLSDSLERGGALRMAFLYDTKQRGRDRSHDTIALAYIGEIKSMWLGVKDARIGGPTKVSERTYDYWRLDFSAPGQVPRYNSAVVITLSDRRILVIRAGAPSQSELDSEVDSLERMRFDNSQK